MILRLSLELPEELAYIRITRVLGRALLDHLQVVQQDIDDIEILVGELCGNVVRHAQSSEDRYHVLLEYFSGQVKIVVRDRGAGFSFKDVPMAGTNRADFDGGQRVGGYGMQIIQGLSDRIEFRRTDPHGTTVCAEKTLHYRSMEAERDAAALDHADGRAAITVS